MVTLWVFAKLFVIPDGDDSLRLKIPHLTLKEVAIQMTHQVFAHILWGFGLQPNSLIKNALFEEHYKNTVYMS